MNPWSLAVAAGLAFGAGLATLINRPPILWEQARERWAARRRGGFQWPQSSPEWARAGSNLIQRFYSKEQRNALAYFGITPDGLGFVQAVIIVGGLVVTAPLAYGPPHFTYGPMLVLMAGYVPQILVVRLYRQRQASVRAQLSRLVEFLYQFLQSGDHNVATALKALAPYMRGAMRQEIRRVNTRIEQLGSVGRALDEFSRRMNVLELTRFLTALRFADEQGELLELFDKQADAIRRLKFAAREEQLRRLPTLMIYPAALPVIAVILLLGVTLMSDFIGQFGGIVPHGGLGGL